MKKIFSIALALVMIASFAVMAASCSSKTPGDEAETGDKSDDGDKSFKVGFIFLHDKNSTYDLNFINAVEAAQEALSLTDSQVILKTNIPEGQENASKHAKTL